MKNPFKGIKGIKIYKKVPLSKYTSFHIGGNADYLITVYSNKALQNTFKKIKKYKMKYYILGAGTNLLVADSGFSGVIIRLAGIFRKLKQKKQLFCCGGGLLLERFVNMSAQKGYQGAEFLAGIPGTIGGAVKGNAGAFGKSISDIIESVVLFDGNIFKEYKKSSIKFGYRTSSIKNGTIITEVKLKLISSNPATVKNKITRYLEHRKKKQPKIWSAGSFFKNPPGLAAGKIIEECGLKGLAVGDAEVSRKHANFIVNRGGATAEQVIALAKKIKRIVKNKKGIILKEEVKLLK